MAELDTLSDSDKRRYNTEQETLAWRLKWALACMGPDTSGEAEGEASLAQLRMHVNLKTKSPPCEGWEELCDLTTLVTETACTFDYMVAASTAVTSLDEVVKATKRLEAQREPLMKLVKSISRGVADLKVAQAATARVEKQRLAQEAKRKQKAEAVATKAVGHAAPPKPAVRTRPIFEHALACGREPALYASVAELSQADLDLTAPWILRDPRLGNILEEVGVRAAGSGWCGRGRSRACSRDGEPGWAGGAAERVSSKRGRKGCGRGAVAYPGRCATGVGGCWRHGPGGRTAAWPRDSSGRCVSLTC
ncbi:MAG: hypothetical protein GY772_26995 [bacterium]|nr:hypothetical protein [bacterium]